MDKQRENSAEVRDLERCINNLVSVLALPAMWNSASPDQIVETLCDALLDMLDLEFVHARLTQPPGAAAVETTRVAEWCEPGLEFRTICDDLARECEVRPRGQPTTMQRRLHGDKISTVSLPVGFEGEMGMVAAGSGRADFPNRADRVVLNVAVNEAVIGMQQARMLSEQKRVAEELERRVKARTAELALANEALRNENAERRRGEGGLLRSEAALQHALGEIRKSEAKLRQVIDAIPALAWCNLPDGTNEFLSKGWHEYTGLSPEESHGWGWQAAFHADDLPPLMKKWQELLISGDRGEIEARLRRHDGIYRWFLIRVAPFRDDTGRIARWYGTSTDIHDRKLAEEALQSSESRLLKIINTMPTAAWSTRPDGYCDFLNQRWLDYTGITAEEAQGWGWRDAIHPDDRAALVEYWQSCLASGTPVETEARMRRFDGTYRWFIFRANPLREESGAIVRWYGANIDIEDRRQSEEGLRESEQRFRLIVDGIAGLVAIMSPSGELEVVNNQVLTYFGKSVEELKGWAMSDAVHPADVAATVSAWTRSVETATVYDTDHRLLRADGEYRWFHARGLPLRDAEGRVLRWYILLTDINDRKQAEEALARARAELAQVARVTSLGVLTASIAHEVNQPLSGIVTNASTCLRMLSGNPPNIEGARETAQRTIRDGNRASEVITRLRALFRSKEAAAERVDLNDAAREVIALSLPELQNNRIILRHELAENLPAVRGDRIQLQQVILNLLHNASDAMSDVEDRPRQLLIRTESDHGGNVRLIVQDTGIGFAPETVDRIFESFYTTKPDGMGIGLSVSRSIIEAHRGRLWATPNDGPGSSVAFSIPCDPELHPLGSDVPG